MSEETKTTLENVAEKLNELPKDQQETVGTYILGVIAGASMKPDEKSA